MTAKDRILVSGAAGQTGRAIVDALQESRESAQIVCGVYSADAQRQRSLLSKYNVDVVEVDALKPETLPPALGGVRTLILVPVGHENRDAVSKNFIDAAVASRVENIVLVSTFLADTLDHYFAEQFREIEKELEKRTTLSWCIVRPNFYYENFLLYTPQFKKGVVPLPIEEQQFAPVAVSDVGAMIARIALNFPEHRGKSYGLTGPEVVSGQCIAEIATKALGKSYSFDKISIHRAADILAELRVPRDTSVGLIGYYHSVRQGNYKIVCAKDFERVVGRPPISLLEWFQLHRECLTCEKEEQPQCEAASSK